MTFCNLDLNNDSKLIEIYLFQAVETQTWNSHVLLETNAYQSMTRAMEFLSAKMEAMKKIAQVFKTSS